MGGILLGAAKPAHILTPSSTVRRIVNMTALAVVDAKPIGACGRSGSVQRPTKPETGYRPAASMRIEGGNMATSTSVPAWDTVALAKQLQTIANGGGPSLGREGASGFVQ